MIRIIRDILDAIDIGFKGIVTFGAAVLPLAVIGMNAIPAALDVAGEAGVEVEEEWLSIAPMMSAVPAIPVAEAVPAAVATEAVAEKAAPDAPVDGEKAEKAARAEPVNPHATKRTRPTVASGGVEVHHRRVETTAAAPSKGKGKKCLEPVDDIRQLTDTRYEVERDIIERYARDLKALDGLGNAYEHTNALGEHDGFRVGGVRCGNALHQGGLRNGDVVHTVNGKRVNNVLQAVATYVQVRNKDEIVIEITRKGERRRLVYRIV